MRPIKPAAGEAPNRPVLKSKACNACQIRKVKCDRGLPCSNCRAWSLDCTFPSPIRKCRRASSKTLAGASKASRQISVEDVMKRLEDAMNDLELAANNHQIGQSGLDSSGSCLVAHDPNANTARLRVLHMRLGALLVNENPNTVLLGGASETPTPLFVTRNVIPAIPPSTWFGLFHSDATTQTLELRHSHLSRAQIPLCWKVFVECIDPLVKVLHKPAAEKLIQNAILDPSSLKEGEQALVLAICFSSMCSMPPVEIENHFHMPKQKATSIYRHAIDQALSRADILATEDLTTIQAMVLYLSFVRFAGESRRTWVLMGLARRLETALGADLTPFKEEMRRRLWWQLWYLDHRANEDPGQGTLACDSLSTPDMPLNINDSDLGFDTPVAPRSRIGWTEMSFALARFEIAQTAMRVQRDLPEYEKERLIDECDTRIHTNYLDNYHGNESIYWLGQHVSHVLVMEMRFKMHHDRLAITTVFTQPRQIRDQLFLCAMDIVDAPRRLQEDPEAKWWLWLLRAYLQFLPLRFLLEELCHRQVTNQVDYAWEVVGCASRRWGDDLKSSKHGSILAELMERAKTWREQLMLRSQHSDPILPFQDPSALENIDSTLMLDPSTLGDFSSAWDDLSNLWATCPLENNIETTHLGLIAP